jgi:hypothetical protein
MGLETEILGIEGMIFRLNALPLQAGNSFTEKHEKKAAKAIKALKVLHDSLANTLIANNFAEDKVCTKCGWESCNCKNLI